MTVTAFLKEDIIAKGKAAEVAESLRALPPLARSEDLLVFDDETGRQIDLDLRPQEDGEARRGRPALGVKAREVTLLPRHWDWLRSQRGGASAVLRRLVEEAMKQGRSEAECRDAAYCFLSVMAGNLPKYEDALRELYAGNPVGYDHFSHEWPAAIRAHGRQLAWPGDIA